MTAPSPSFRCQPDEPAPRREHETKCSNPKCGKLIVLVNPSNYELETPLCPLCEIASFEGVCRLLGYPKPKSDNTERKTP